MKRIPLYPVAITPGNKKEHANRIADLHAQLKSLVSTKPIVLYQDCKCKVSQLIDVCQDNIWLTMNACVYELAVLI